MRNVLEKNSDNGSDMIQVKEGMMDHIDQSPVILPYKTRFPPGIQLYNPPSFLFVRARFACINKEARGAVYQIREILIIGAKPPKKFRQDKVI